MNDDKVNDAMGLRLTDGLVQHHIERAHRMRAEAMRNALKGLARRLGKFAGARAEAETPVAGEPQRS